MCQNVPKCANMCHLAKNIQNTPFPPKKNENARICGFRWAETSELCGIGWSSIGMQNSNDTVLCFAFSRHFAYSCTVCSLVQCLTHVHNDSFASYWFTDSTTHSPTLMCYRSFKCTMLTACRFPDYTRSLTKPCLFISGHSI